MMLLRCEVLWLCLSVSFILFGFLRFQNQLSLEHGLCFLFVFCGVGYSVKGVGCRIYFSQGKLLFLLTKFLCPFTVRSQPLLPACQERLRHVQLLNTPGVKKCLLQASCLRELLSAQVLEE